MARQDFQERIARIQAGGGGLGVALAGEGHTQGGGFGADPGRPGSAPGAGGPGFSARFLVWLALMPMGFALSFLTRLFLDPDITPEAAHYTTLLALVAGGHLLLVAGAIATLVEGFRRKALNTVMFAALAGYGIGSALLGQAIQ